jgi:hypothetical protein
MNKVGKDADQLMYTFTRDRKKYDPPKKSWDNKHEFIDYILNLKDGKISISTLTHYTCIQELGKRPLVSLYDDVTFKRLGKTYTTTVGRLIINKVVFASLWDNKVWDLVLTPLYGDGIENLVVKIKDYMIEDKIKDPNAIKQVIDRYTEFGLRLSTIYNANVTNTMILSNEEFDKHRDETLNAIKEKVENEKDVELLNKTIDGLVEDAKKEFKDDQMMEIYESKNSGKLDNHFRNMNIAMGGLPMIGGGTAVILDSLGDGVKPVHFPALANVGMVGAISRAKQTALAGTLLKQISNAMQNIRGIKGDCGSKEGIVIRNARKVDLMYKYVLNSNGSQTYITSDNVDKYIGKTVEVRHVLKCKMKDGHFCSHCIGEEPFKLAGRDNLYIGMFVFDVSSAILNMFMKMTHNLGADIFRIVDLDKFIYPTPPKGALFEIRYDPLEKVDKVYCNTDITWYVPKSALTPEGTNYKILAHGSIIENETHNKYTFTLGTQIITNPTELLKPGHPSNPSLTHYKLVYKKGDAIIEDTIIPRDEMTVYKMFNIFFKGSISNLIPLETHLEVFHNTISNNKKVNISDISMGLIIASLARDAANTSKPARETGSKDYVMISCDDLTIMSGTFNAFFGNDAKRALAISVAKDPDKQDEVISPMEVAYRN